MRFLKCLGSVVAGLTFFASYVQAHSQSREPLNYLALVEDPQIHTHNHRVHAFSHFDLTFDLHQHTQHIRLSLEPNHDIIGEGAVHQVLDKDGNIKYTQNLNRLDYKVFQGQAYVIGEDGLSQHVGWARIFVGRDGIHPIFEGAFTVMGDHHHIQMKSTYMASKHVLDPDLEDSDDEYMTVYRDSDVGHLSHTELRKRAESKSCAADTLAFNIDTEHPIRRAMLKRDQGTWGKASISHLFGKRQTNIDGGGAGNGNSAGVNLRNSIGDTSGCPNSRQVALLGVATDCTYTGSFNSTKTMQDHIVQVVNTASDLYQSTFNITLGLRNITTSDAECPGTAASATPWNIGCSGSTTITERLNTFSQWRGNLAGDTNAYWSLFTTCNTGAEVGLAWLGQLCNHGATSQNTGGSAQSVTGANVIAKTSNEWQVFAHETGHTFGAVHDCDSSVCQNSNAVSSSQCCPLSQDTCDAQAQYMMNPYSSARISRFSPCSIGNICSALGRNAVSSGCLTDNRGVDTFTGQQCGNGIVEDGEDCDCGGADGCANNACCNPTTCKFNSGAVCDPSNDGCCTGQCQFSAAGSVCRASTGQCDPQETCSGNDAACPADTTTPDGTGCGDGLQCASGQCTSRDLQCKTIMGSYTQGNDTYACDSQQCQLSCASPDFGMNVCYSMQQNFLDGTICGGGGRCDNGVCRGSTAGGQIKSWIEDNRTLVIALGSAIGGLILIAVAGCVFRACRRNRYRKKRQAWPKPTSSPTNMGWNGPSVPPGMASRSYSGPQNTNYQHGGNDWRPQPPPQPPRQSYTPYSPGNSSVRYA